MDSSIQMVRPDRSIRSNKNNLILFSLLLCLVALFLLSLSLGTVKINMWDYLQEKLNLVPHSDSFTTTDYIITQVRLPRITLSLIVGFALSLGGVIMQTILRNPLASPHTLGVSSGAAFGAATAMILGESILQMNLLFTGYGLVAFNAFIGGTISLLIVVGVARLNQNSTTILILSGVAISSLFSAGVSLLKYFSNAEALKNLEVWLMGGFWGANWHSITLLTPLLIISFFLLIRQAWEFNALNAGEETAISLGVNIKRTMTVSLLLVTLIASASIAFSGVIGFIGLVAPHIGRNLLGVDNRSLLPGAMLIGAIILLASDTVGRTIISPIEIPVGIITALIGVPFFIAIMAKGNKKMWM